MLNCMIMEGGETMTEKLEDKAKRIVKNIMNMIRGYKYEEKCGIVPVSGGFRISNKDETAVFNTKGEFVRD